MGRSSFIAVRESRRRPRRLIGLGLAGMLLLVGCSTQVLTGSAADAATSISSRTAADVGAVCQKAGDLVSNDQPQEALAVIDQLRAGLPKDSQACDGERAAAVALQAANQLDTPTGAKTLGAAWAAFVRDWIAPIQDSGAAFLGLLVGFAVVARLVAFLPWWNARPSGRPQRALAFFGGTILILVAALALVAVPARWSEQALAGVLGAGLIGLLGATLLGIFVAQRLAVTVDVRTKEGDTNASRIGRLGAYVAELGQQSPRGRLLPKGTDATGLEGSKFFDRPESKVLAALVGIIRGLFGSAPWLAVVSESEDGSLAVAISRNSHSLESVNIEREILGVPRRATDDQATPSVQASSDLYRIAAAVIVMTVSKKYAGFDGLCGATDWRSVGLQFVASTEAAEDEERAVKLLAMAVDDDKDNELAVLALAWQRHRFATEAGELQAHAIWLKSRVAEEKKKNTHVTGREALLHRLLLNYLTTACNLKSIAGHEEDEPEAKDLAQEFIKLLEEDAPRAEKEAKRRGTAISLVQQMQPFAVLAFRRLGGKPTGEAIGWLTAADRSADPHVKYNLACYYASGPDLDENKAYDLLEDAVQLPGLRKWARSDPALAHVRVKPRFARLLGMEPRTSWLTVHPFALHEAKLAKLGIARPGLLLAARASGTDLQEDLDVTSLELAALLRADELFWHVKVRNPGDEPFQLELAEGLFYEGMEDPDQLALMTPGARVALSEKIAYDIGLRCAPAPKAADVRLWLEMLSLT